MSYLTTAFFKGVPVAWCTYKGQGVDDLGDCPVAAKIEQRMTCLMS